MKNKLLIGLILGMTVLCVTATFGQPNLIGSERTKEDKGQEIHLGIFLNSVSAILSHEDSNTSLKTTNRMNTSHTVGNFVLDWCYSMIFNFIQKVFYHEG